MEPLSPQDGGWPPASGTAASAPLRATRRGTDGPPGVTEVEDLLGTKAFKPIFLDLFIFSFAPEQFEGGKQNLKQSCFKGKHGKTSILYQPDTG